MINVDVKVQTKRNMKYFLKDLETLSEKRVLVGVPGNSEERKDQELNNAQLAYIHDQGAPRAGIPARPFLIPGIAKVQNKINSLLKRCIQAKLDGDKVKEYDSLWKAGLVAQNSVRTIIMDNEGFEPIKRTTALGRLRKRKYLQGKFKGNKSLKEEFIGSFKALIDTGQLLKSITFVIEKIKK